MICFRKNAFYIVFIQDYLTILVRLFKFKFPYSSRKFHLFLIRLLIAPLLNCCWYKVYYKRVIEILMLHASRRGTKQEKRKKKNLTTKHKHQEIRQQYVISG